MRIIVWGDGFAEPLECGPGTQTVSWLGRVAAQRFSTGGTWCISYGQDLQTIPRQYVAGHVIKLPEGQVLEATAIINQILQEGAEVKVELRESPVPPLPSVTDGGPEEAIIPPKFASRPGLCQVFHGNNGFVLKATGVPSPQPHEGYSFEAMWAELRAISLLRGRDRLQLQSLEGLLKRHFVRTVHELLHGVPIEAIRDDPRARVQPPKDDLDHLVGPDLSDYEFSFPLFVEALCRIAVAKYVGLYALADQMNRLFLLHLLPFARHDIEDPLKDNLFQTTTWRHIAPSRATLWRWYRKSIHLEQKPRALTLKQFAAAMKTAEQIDADVTLPLVKQAVVDSLTLRTKVERIADDDDTIEISSVELIEIFTRIAYMRFKNPDERLESKLELQVKRFLRALGERDRV